MEALALNFERLDFGCRVGEGILSIPGDFGRP
jgi:hypothetical protein